MSKNAGFVIKQPEPYDGKSLVTQSRGWVVSLCLLSFVLLAIVATPHNIVIRLIAAGCVAALLLAVFSGQFLSEKIERFATALSHEVISRSRSLTRTCHCTWTRSCRGAPLRRSIRACTPLSSTPSIILGISRKKGIWLMLLRPLSPHQSVMKSAWDRPQREKASGSDQRRRTRSLTYLRSSHNITIGDFGILKRFNSMSMEYQKTELVILHAALSSRF